MNKSQFNDYIKGLLWCKQNISDGVSEDIIQAYLDCSDFFDKGARDYLCGKDVLIA